MTRKPCEAEISLFQKACDECNAEYGEGFGICNEKRLHRVLKKYTLECELLKSAKAEAVDGYEVKIGKHVADLLLNGTVFEIQTKSVRPLAPKIKYYLEQTDYNVVIVCPIRAKTCLIRVDKDSGEVIRKRYSPKKESIFDRLYDLVYIGEYLSSPRVSIRFLEISADEYRYSEKMRYRKKGAYECELYPRELLSVAEYNFVNDIEELTEMGKIDASEFSAAEYGKEKGLSGRRLYNTLNFFCAVGIFLKEKVNGKFIYRRTK